MLNMALLALVGGFVLGFNRILITKVGQRHGIYSSSVWNHLGGLIFVFLWILFFGSFKEILPNTQSAPSYLLIGGVIGALFVALNSLLIPKLGLLITTTLIISGQMVLGVFIDYFQGRIESLPQTLLGLIIILAGVSLRLFPANRKPTT